MREILRRALAALRGFLVGFTGMPSRRLAHPANDGSSGTEGARRALGARSERRPTCC